MILELFNSFRHFVAQYQRHGNTIGQTDINY